MIALALAVGLATLYFYLTRTFDYWQKRGVKHDKPWPLFGNNAKNFLMQANLADMATEAYRKYPGEKIFGFFKYSKPELIIRDPALAKRILTDSTYFHRRGIFPKDFRIEPLHKNLFSADDDLWRLLRSRLTSAFSSGKLKAMFPLIIERTKQLQNRLQKIAEQEKPIDARDLMQQYTTDVIGAIGFGVNSDSLNGENTAFRQLGLKLISYDFIRILKLNLKQIFPIFFGHLKVLYEIEKEIMCMMKMIMQQRNNEPSGRNDFIDLLLECKKKGAMTGESIVQVNADGSPKKISIEIDDEIMAAQISSFFAAGFEAPSTGISHGLHQLAHNPRKQQKAQEEIDHVLAKHGNKLSYDAILEMTYLRWCLDESQRIFPSSGFLQRQCVRTYTIPDVDVTIDPGVNVRIPVAAYHNDPKIFPEPKQFHPERFDPELLTAEQKLAYLPFGLGPRACVGTVMIELALAVGLAALYFYLTRTFDYWQKRGVKHDKPWPLFGNNAKNFLMLANSADMATEAYRKYPGEKIVGFFKYSKPELIIRDPALAKRILTDFTYFHRRGFFPKDFQIEPLQKNLLSADDDLWRLLRSRLTSAFSSGKLKAMFPLIVERTERLQNRLQKIAEQKKPIDARDLMQQYTTDVIGTIGFGVNSDSLNGENTAFRQLGLKLISYNFIRILKLNLKQIFPIFFGHLKVLYEIEKEITCMMKMIMQQRNNEPSGRNDFIDLLLECKKKGAMTGESIVEVNADGSPKKISIEMDDEIMAAQISSFFAGGFETSSSGISHGLHQLAHNPREQQKAQEEIDHVLAKHDNKLSYNAILEMTYLRWCLDESLRIFPSGGVLQRQCVHAYTIPDVDVTIDPGVTVRIPVAAYHNDPRIFREPKQFRPERFDPEALTSEQKLAYLPFGLGPRACVAERLGLMQSLAGLAAVLAQYSVAPAPGAPRDPPTNPRSNIVQSFRCLPLIFHQRRKM